MPSTKRKSNSPATSNKKGKDGPTLPALHAVQLDVAERVKAALEQHGSAYLVAPAGTGKSAMLRALLRAPTTAVDASGAHTAPAVGGAGVTSSGVVSVLNLVVVPTTELITEMAGKMRLSLTPPFNGSKMNSLRRLLEYPKPHTVVTIAVTHDFLKRKLNPPKNDRLATFKDFVEKVGNPTFVRLLVDEAHNLCTGGRGGGGAAETFASWSALLREQIELFKYDPFNATYPTTVEVVMASATPKLHLERFKKEAKAMLGCKDLADVLVEYTDDEVTRFRADLCTLPAPAETPTIVELAAPYPNESLEGQLGQLLEALATLVVGDMLYIVEQCRARAAAHRRRRQVHACNAMKNLVSEILAIVAHHGAEGHATGGQVFAALERKVSTHVVEGGTPGTRVSKAGECVLVVHHAARGLNKHRQLLCAMEPDPKQGVPHFSAHDLSGADKNTEREKSAHTAFLAAFDHQTTDKMFGKTVDAPRKGHVIGLVLPKKMEGTDKYNERVTKTVIIGPTDSKVEAQTRGRTHRPPKYVNGMRVRKDATEMVQLRSTWASAVFALERLPRSMSVLDAPEEVLEKVKSLSGFDADSRDLACKYATQLFLAAEGGGDETQALLPGQLVELFFTLLGDDTKLAAFLEEGSIVNRKRVGMGDYFTVVAKYAKDELDEEEDDDEEVDEEDADEHDHAAGDADEEPNEEEEEAEGEEEKK